jgi:ABC-type enterochelin transport system permease subunit
MRKRTIKMAKEDKDIKVFSLRVPRDLWLLLKRASLDQEVSMTNLIVQCLEKNKKSLKKG